MYKNEAKITISHISKDGPFGLVMIETISINEGYYAYPEELIQEINRLILSVPRTSALEKARDDVKKAQNVEDQSKIEKANSDKIVKQVQKDLNDMTETYKAELQKFQKEKGAVTESQLKEATNEIDTKRN